MFNLMVLILALIGIGFVVHRLSKSIMRAGVFVFLLLFIVLSANHGLLFTMKHLFLTIFHRI